MTPSKYVQDLINDLQHPNWEIRERATKKLGEGRCIEAVEPLIAALDHPSPMFRLFVVDALAKIGDPRASEPLVEKLKDDKVAWHIPEALIMLAEKGIEINMPKVRRLLKKIVDDAATDKIKMEEQKKMLAALMEITVGMRKGKKRMKKIGVLSCGLPKPPKGRKGLVRMRRVGNGS